MTPPTNIPTPRTDAHAKVITDYFDSHSDKSMELIPFLEGAPKTMHQFARTLERENVVLRRALNRYSKHERDCPGHYGPCNCGLTEALTPPTTI